jgi:eukaryotic-like serine/threonine-protein kinase
MRQAKASGVMSPGLTTVAVRGMSNDERVERQERVKALVDQALALDSSERARFLDQSCAGEERLRADVDSLLRHESETILEPADEAVPDGLVGRQVGHYRILECVGRGGMGEVYRAHDARLGRDVAVKVLPAAYASDSDRLARFRREARLLAALNHPNIAAIYGLEDSDDLRALILELVEGPTLAERLARDGGQGVPLSLDEALTIARQISIALESAHARGIIHRDLKPANVKVPAAGPVKVLDFGLAKAWAPANVDVSHAPTLSGQGTREGLIAGTPAYMSPEQARGKVLDERSDIWAFGCVLFEMLGGRAAFAGETLSDTLAHVLEREPDWSALPASTPSRVRNLLRRCLQKDPGKRPRRLAEARADIEAVLASPFQGLRVAAEAVRWGLAQRASRVVLVALLLGVAGAFIVRLLGSRTPVPTLVNPVQVTSAVGVEDHPTWSPDDRTLAYESLESGNWDIWLAQVGGGPAVNRTADHLGSDRYPSWSPDGRQIAFWSDRDGGAYYLMPALGGQPTKMIATPGTGQYYHSAPEWSADGARLAGVVYSIVGSRFEQSVDIVSVETRESRTLRLPGTEEARLDLSWSRDGRYMAYVEAGQQQAEVARLRVLRLSDGRSIVVTQGRTNVRRPRWSLDGRFLFYVCNCVGPSDLWRQRIGADGSPSGQPERVTTGLDVRDAAFSPDGSRLVYSKGRWVSNFWRVPILQDRPATWADAQQVTFDQAYVEFLDVSPDGRRVAYSSDRAGNQDLWVMPIGGEPVPLTTDPAPDWAPGWSPDGKRLAFYSYRTGDREIWTMPAMGGAAKQLTRSPGLDAGSQWSPDGREIAFRSERTGDSEVWVIGADGTGLRRITRNPANDSLPTWSPDGRWLAFSSNRGGRTRIWRAPSRGGTEDLLTQGPGLSPRWYGDDIYFTGVEERQGNVWRYSVRDRRERPATHLVGRRGTLGIMTPATGGKFLYFPWRDDLGDIWVMDVVQG